MRVISFNPPRATIDIPAVIHSPARHPIARVITGMAKPAVNTASWTPDCLTPVTTPR